MSQCLGRGRGAPVERLCENIYDGLLLRLLLLRGICHLVGILTSVGALAEQGLSILPNGVHQELHLLKVAPSRFLAQFHLAGELVAQALPTFCTFLF